MGINFCCFKKMISVIVKNQLYWYCFFKLFCPLWKLQRSIHCKVLYIYSIAFILSFRPFVRLSQIFSKLNKLYCTILKANGQYRCELPHSRRCLFFLPTNGNMSIEIFLIRFHLTIGCHTKLFTVSPEFHDSWNI